MVMVTLQAMVMVFGAVIASAGLLLLFLRKEQAQNKIKLFGQEFEISTPALVVFLVGCAVFVMPLVISIKNIDKPVIIVGPPSEGPSISRGGQGTGNAPPDLFPVLEEKEPNDQIINANLIELETTVRGSIATKQDRDFFKIKTSSGTTRVILRKFSLPGFGATVEIYDSVEKRLEHGTAFGDKPVTLSFESQADSYYYILAKSYNYKYYGDYELTVRKD